MKLTEIQDLIKFVARAGVTEVEIEQKEFKITIKSEMPKGKGKGAEPVVQTIQVPAPCLKPWSRHQPRGAAPVTPAAPAAYCTRSRTGRRSPKQLGGNQVAHDWHLLPPPSPDKDVFVEVGDQIKAGDTVCVVEAMKLFNEIESEIQGKIVKVLVEDNSPIEYDQPLFLVDPS